VASESEHTFGVLETAAARQSAEEAAVKALAGARARLILGRDARSAFRRIVWAGLDFRASDLARLPTARRLGWPLGTPCGILFSARFTRVEQKGVGRAPTHVRLQDDLRAGAKGDDPFATTVRHLVTRRPIQPNVTRLVDVARPHQYELSASHAGQHLEADHCGNPATESRDDLVHDLRANRLDGVSFPCSRAAALQAPDRLQGVKHRGRDDLLGHTELEKRLDSTDPLVDVRAGVPGLDPLVPQGLQLERGVVGGRQVAEQPPEVPEGLLEMVQFVGDRSVGPAVMDLGVFEEPEDEGADRERLGANDTSTRQPLSDEGLVGVLDGGRGAPGVDRPDPKVVVLAAEGDEGLGRGLVATEGGDAGGTHGGGVLNNPVDYRITRSHRPHFPTVGKVT